MKRYAIFGIILLVLLCLAFPAAARDDGTPNTQTYRKPTIGVPDPAPRFDTRHLATAALVDTYVLAEFDFDNGGGGLDPQGWYGVDLTAQAGTFFRVEDFSGLSGRLAPIDGGQSLWCGQRADPYDERFCNYNALPGYGNSWIQMFESTEFSCSGDVILKFKASHDSEPHYDQTFVQYLSKTGSWNELMMIEDVGEVTATLTVPEDSLNGTVKLRFKFASDGAWSDEDGLWDTEGAIILDSLVVIDDGGVIDYQDFETESVGDTVTTDGDWWARPAEPYGDFAGLFHGITVLQEDACNRNISGLWGFFNGSTYDMACAGHPEQAAIPYGVERDEDMRYLNNEIWSPLIDWDTDIHDNPVPDTATEAYFQFDMYVDNPLNPLISMVWHMRSWIGGCPGSWRDRAFVDFYWGKQWVRRSDWYGDLVQAGAEQIQLALATMDMCQFWCGVYGTGECHRHAPLYDNVRFIRVNRIGPQWLLRDIDMFQDNFASDGTTTGTVRIDTAVDLMMSSSPLVRPGDSLAVTVTAPNVGLDNHTTGVPSSGPAIYIHVKDVSGAKSGAAISGDLSRWPLVGTGGGWTVLRMDSTRRADGYVYPEKFCIDLADDLFTPGDTLLYYLSARDLNGVTTYCHKQPANDWEWVHGVTDLQAAAAARPFEMTCLPANALTGATDILYVDDFHRRGAGRYFETVFDLLGITPDRYDVLGASYKEGNGPGNRVRNVANQIIPCYRKIIWNSGNLTEGTIGDGTGDPGKSDDFYLLYTFLHESTNDPGVYISGDDIASEWVTLTGSYAASLRGTYMNFNLVSGDHVALGEPLSSLLVGRAGSCFEHGGTPDTTYASAGCPVINDFDVIEPYGGALWGMNYSNNPARGAVLTQASTNNQGATARVVLSGFSYHQMRDDRVVFWHDSAEHLLDILRWFGNLIDDPTGGDPAFRFTNTLSQNYPNPFNPVTTIRFSIRDRGHVSLKVYNVAGQLVRTLVDEECDANIYSPSWNGLNENGQQVSSGVYFYRLVAPGFSQTKKMVLLK